MTTTAELTLRDGRKRYVTVVFPNSPLWAETYRNDDNVVHARQLPAGIERRAGGWFVTDKESWSGPWKTEQAALLAQAEKYDEAHALERRS